MFEDINIGDRQKLMYAEQWNDGIEWFVPIDKVLVSTIMLRIFSFKKFMSCVFLEDIKLSGYYDLKDKNKRRFHLMTYYIQAFDFFKKLDVEFGQRINNMVAYQPENTLNTQDEEEENGDETVQELRIQTSTKGKTNRL